MLNRAIQMKSGYMAYCNTDDLMNPYKLKDYEWYYLEKLMNLLERFDHWTKKISASTSYATIYNKLIDNVEDFINANNIDDEDHQNDDIPNTDPNERQQYDELLKNLVSALRTTKEKINKYYSKTDSTNIYAVATAMDCRMKFHWWRLSEWESIYEDLSKSMVTNTWIEYQPLDSESAPLTSLPPNDDDIFFTTRNQMDELGRYISETPSACDPLEFWSRHHGTWPNLARMARDFLAVPATSTPSERCFSRARLLLPYTRNRLTPSSIKRLMLLESWIKVLD
jgi:hypothetical protein